MGHRRVPPPPTMADPTVYRWSQDVWRQLSAEPLIPSVRIVTSNSTLSVGDYTLLVDSSSTATVALLPASMVTFQPFHIKSMGTGVVILDPHSTEVIDGSTTTALGSQYSSIYLQSTGTRWVKLGRV